MGLWGVNSLDTPDAQGDQLDGGEEVLRVFVVAGGNTPELFDPVEEAFDQIPLAIDPGGKGERPAPIGSDRDVGPSPVLFDQGADGQCGVHPSLALLPLLRSIESEHQHLSNREFFNRIGPFRTYTHRSRGGSAVPRERDDLAPPGWHDILPVGTPGSREGMMATASSVPDQLLNQVVSVLQPRRVILFGCRARGDAREDSDIDLVVELDNDAPPEMMSAKVIHSARAGYRAPVTASRRER